MRRHAGLLSFVTRFLPGQRGTLYFLFGSLRMPYRPFFVADGAAAWLQVVLFFFGVRSLGWQRASLAPAFDRADDLLTLALVVVLLVGWVRARRSG
jgi:membrane protein DedA with SNARE-associated domain